VSATYALPGDHVDASSHVRKLVQDPGLFVTGLGGLVSGGRMQQVRALLAGVNPIRLPVAHSDGSRSDLTA